METEHCIFVEEAPCETVSTDIAVEEIVSSVNEVERHEIESPVKFSVFV